jgi:hypothetical protein
MLKANAHETTANLARITLQDLSPREGNETLTLLSTNLVNLGFGQGEG